MVKLHRKFGGSEFTVLGMALRKSLRKTIQPYVAEFHIPYPVLWDPAGAVEKTYGLRYHPSTVLIDREGRIVARATGQRDWTRSEARRLVELVIKGN